MVMVFRGIKFVLFLPLVLDSSEPLSATSSSDVFGVQVMDSSEPLVHAISEPVAGPSWASDTAVPVFPPLSSDSGDVAGPSWASDTAVPVVPPLLYDSGDDAGEGDDAPEVEASGTSCQRPALLADEIKSRWNMFKVFKKLGTKEQCIQFSEERHLIPTHKTCSYHKQPMSLVYSTDGQLGTFQCRKSKCRAKKVSRAKGTWFEQAKLKINIIFQIMYLFCKQASFEEVQVETSREDESVVSTATIADWYSYCREAVVVYELEHNVYETKIGGPGKIVQIDESKFGKRKYNRGRHIEGHWVLGMVEDRSDDLRLEVCPDNNRSAEVLVPLIEKHVEKGTEIHTDFWKAYDCLSQHGYFHKKVNHSDKTNKFVASDGTHTQRIESQWRNIKRKFHKDQFKGDFAHWLIEFNWRRKIKLSKKDLFEELLNVISYVYKIKN